MKEIFATLIMTLVFAAGLFLHQNNVDIAGDANPSDISILSSGSPEASASASESQTIESELNQIEAELAELEDLVNFDDF